jgi:hypothetical protein
MIKTILSLLTILLFGMSSAQTTETPETTNTGQITFTNLQHNFGTVEFNANGTCEFEFTNTGKVAFILKNVQTTAGCSAPGWSKEPFKPGDVGKITVKYNTQIPGPFQKQIRVYSSATATPVVLIIKGEVKPQAQP